MTRRARLLTAVVGLFLFTSTQATARDFIRIVGSSTVFPFAALVAEEFSLKTPYATPIIEQLGTGGGFKLFCGGLGTSGRFDYPDIANASRTIKPDERAECLRNGVQDIMELKIGYDGIVLANVRGGSPVSLSLTQLYLGLAARIPRKTLNGYALIDNPHQLWSDIGPDLPDIPILVYGPPPSSGTRDAFVSGALLPGCLQHMETLGAVSLRLDCERLRADGRFIEAGESDNFIVQRLRQNPNAVGILPFASVDQNPGIMQSFAIEGIMPDQDSISSRRYPIARPMYIYVKVAHASAIPGLTGFVEEFLSRNAMGPYGYLIDKGLVRLPQNEWVDSQVVASRLQKNVSASP